MGAVTPAVLFLLVFQINYGGSVWHDKADAIALPRAECATYAKQYGDGVSASCYRPKEFRALGSTPRWSGHRKGAGNKWTAG